MAIFYYTSSLYTTLLASDSRIVIGDWYINQNGSAARLTGQTGALAGGTPVFQNPSANPVPAGIKNPPAIPKLYKVINSSATFSSNVNSPLSYNPISVYGGQSLANGSTTYGTCNVTVTPALPAGLSFRLSNVYTTITSIATPVLIYAGAGFRVEITVALSDNFTAGTYYRVSGNTNSIYNGNYLCTAVSPGKITFTYPQTFRTTAAFTPGTGGIITDSNIQSVVCPEANGNDSVGVSYLYNYNNFCIVGTPSASTPATNYTVSFTDNLTTTTANFNLEIKAGNAPIVLTVAQPNDYPLKRKVPIAPFTPIKGSGGASYLIYSISPSLPVTDATIGLQFSSSNGQISGLPDTVSEPSVKYLSLIHI